MANGEIIFLTCQLNLCTIFSHNLFYLLVATVVKESHTPKMTSSNKMASSIRNSRKNECVHWVSFSVEVLSSDTKLIGHMMSLIQFSHMMSISRFTETNTAKVNSRKQNTWDFDLLQLAGAWYIHKLAYWILTWSASCLQTFWLHVGCPADQYSRQVCNHWVSSSAKNEELPVFLNPSSKHFGYI